MRLLARERVGDTSIAKSADSSGGKQHETDLVPAEQIVRAAMRGFIRATEKTIRQFRRTQTGMFGITKY
jgi:hypothetical protein